MAPDVVTHMLGVAAGAGSLLGLFVALTNSWLP